MTLLEVMVALVVFAIAGLAVMKTASEHLSGLSYLEQKTLATWVVQNQLVQQRLEGSWPSDSWVEGMKRWRDSAGIGVIAVSLPPTATSRHWIWRCVPPQIRESRGHDAHLCQPLNDPLAVPCRWRRQ